MRRERQPLVSISPCWVVITWTLCAGVRVCMFVVDGFVNNLEWFTLRPVATGLTDVLFFRTSTAERICSLLSPSVKQRAKAIRCFQNVWLRHAGDCKEVSVLHHVSPIKTFQSRSGTDGCCEWSRCNNRHVMQNEENRHVILTFHESGGGEANRRISVFQLKLCNSFLHFYFFEAVVWLYCHMQYILSKTVMWQGKRLLKQYCLYILGFFSLSTWGLFSYHVTLVLKHRRLLGGFSAFRTETVVQAQPLRNCYPNRSCSRSQLTIDFQASAQ